MNRFFGHWRLPTKFQPARSALVAAFRKLCATDDPHRMTLRILAASVGVFLLWAAVFPVDIASLAQGEVVPVGRTTRVQHLEGGIVEHIHVEEGDVVRRGQPLVELTNVASSADLGELRARIAALSMSVARLHAQLNDRDVFELDAEAVGGISEQRAALFASNRQLLLTEKLRLTTDLATQQAKIGNVKAEIVGLERQIAGLGETSVLLDRQVTMSERLLKKGLTNEYEHLELLKERQRVRMSVQQTRDAILSSRARLKTETALLAEIEAERRGSWQLALTESLRQLDEFRERFRKVADSDQRTVIRSPLDGVVLMRAVTSPGMVVQPGGTVMTLVPEDSGLIIEAKLPVRDIGFVSVGQKSRVSLSAGVRGFGPISGTVVSVSADAISDSPDHPPFYLVKVRVEENCFRNGEATYELIPGVQVNVAILTGMRTVLAYLFAPLVVDFRQGFQER